MRYVIGDIHGYYKPLSIILHTIKPSKSDMVITLGDYIDRGPQSKEVIDTLINLSKKTQLVSIRGNHEQMLLDCLTDPNSDFKLWNSNGAGATFRSYGLPATRENVQYLPKSHINFFQNTLEIAESDDYIFVHGGLDPTADLDKQNPDIVLWKRFEKAKPHKSGKCYIVGHTPVDSGIPQDKGFAIDIDTGIISTNGWLSCLTLETGAVLQVNQKGKTRLLKI